VTSSAIEPRNILDQRRLDGGGIVGLRGCARQRIGLAGSPRHDLGGVEAPRSRDDLEMAVGQLGRTISGWMTPRLRTVGRMSDTSGAFLP
jgi:hypothetical protein